LRRRRQRLTDLGTAGLVALVALALMAGFAGGVLLDLRILSGGGGSIEAPANAVQEFRLIAEGWRTIEREYVNQAGLEPRPMAYGALSGIVRTLGDAGHTRFLTPEMVERHQNQLEGEFEGIGAYVEMEDGRSVIVAPIDDSPAQRVGLKPGDVILEVDGEDVTGLRLDEVVNRVLGPAGTEVTLMILDPDTGETREVALERAEVELDLVTWQRIPESSLAYVRVSAFSEGVTDELEQTLAEIDAEEIEGLLLDLRNNPGGLLSEAVGVTSHFVEDGEVLRRRGAGGSLEVETVRRGVDATEFTMVALINGGTSSGAEIVTGALQDHERATMVGTTTFGAGTVLNEFTLSDGSVLLLAVEEWLTPDGRVIWQEGLPPDVMIGLPEEAEPLVRTGQEEITAEALRQTEDVQFLGGLELLREPSRRLNAPGAR